jgi:hypothetical protein
MRTAKHRKIKNRTLKGGHIPNTKVNLIVRKSKIDPSSEKLIYDLIIKRPAFPFITDYMWNSMNAVDEALALIRMEEVPVKPEIGTVNKPESDVLYKDEFEYGYNKIDDTPSTPTAVPSTPTAVPPIPAATSLKQAVAPPISVPLPSTPTTTTTKKRSTTTSRPADPLNIKYAARELSDASSKAARQIVGNKTRLTFKLDNERSGNNSPESLNELNTIKTKTKQRRDSAKRRVTGEQARIEDKK